MAGGMQVASLFASFGVDSSGLQSGLSGAQTSMAGMAKDFGLKVLGITSVSGLAIGAVKGVMDSVSDWSTYNIEMDRGATATGMAADQYSRLVQAADDSRVPIEKMTTALEMATKNGYPMTIEGLGQIADKLNGMTDPAEKAKAAMAIFGRGWADIMPFLKQGSEGIDKATAAIADNMIATDESIAKSQAYATAVDDLQDAYTGLRNELATGFMPVLTNTMSGITAGNNLRTTTKELIDAEVISQEEYNNALRTDALNSNTNAMQALYDGHVKEYDAQVISTAALYTAQDAWDANTIAVTSLTVEGNAYSSMIDAAKQNTIDSATYQRELAAAAAEAAAAFRDEKAAVTSLDKNFGGIIGLAKQFDTSLKEIVKQEKIMKDNPIGSEKYNEAKGKVDELKQGMTDLANQVVLDMFQATIAIGGITDSEAAAYFTMAADMGLISTDAATAATTAYSTAIATINGLTLDDKTGNIDLTVDDAALTTYVPPPFNSTVYLNPDAAAVTTYVPPPFNSTVYLQPDSTAISTWIKLDHFMTVKLLADGSGIPSYGKAAGGPVSGNSMYLVGERGPELFVPETNGQIIPNGQTASLLNNSGVSSSGSNSSEGGRAPMDLSDRSVRELAHALRVEFAAIL